MLCLVPTLALVASGVPHEVPATDRRVLPVVILTVTDTLLLTSRTDLLRRLDDAAQAEVDLTVELMLGIEGCQKLGSAADRFTCIAAQAVRDERDTLRDEVLIVSVAQTEVGERFSAVLLDWRLTNQLVAETARDSIGSALRRRAIVARAPPVDARIPDDVQRFVTRLFTDAFRGRLRGDPFGAVELHLDRSGCELRLDGQTLGGLGEAPVTRIVRVRPGRRLVEVQHPTALPAEKTVVVEAGAVVAWRPEFVEADDSPAIANQAVRWTGVAAAVTGGAIGLYGAVTAERGRPCFDGGAGCPDLGAEPHLISGGVRYSSVAIGLSAMGVTAAVSNWILAEDERFPWLDIGLALAAGAAGALAGLAIP